MHSQVIENWVTQLYAEGKANRTVKDRRITLRRFEQDVAKPILTATTGDIAQWLGRDGLAPVTRSVYHSMFTAFFDWANRLGLREDNPMTPIKAAKRPKRRPRPISRPQFERLRDNAPDSAMKAMILLHGLAGLRVHEIARFHSRQLDVEARTIEITGKGGSSFVLPAHPEIVRHSLQMPHGYWFPSQRSRHLGGRTVSERIHLHMLRYRVPGTPHCLRHFFGTELVEMGVSLDVVQELMRHSSLQTTSIYVKTSDQRKRAAIESLVA